MHEIVEELQRLIRDGNDKLTIRDKIAKNV